MTGTQPGVRMPEGSRCRAYFSPPTTTVWPGVVAAVELDDVVDALAEQVRGLALALVAPLGADEHDRGHGPPCDGSGSLGRPPRPPSASARPGGECRAERVPGQPGCRPRGRGPRPSAADPDPGLVRPRAYGRSCGGARRGEAVAGPVRRGAAARHRAAGRRLVGARPRAASRRPGARAATRGVRGRRRRAVAPAAAVASSRRRQAPRTHGSSRSASTSLPGHPAPDGQRGCRSRPRSRPEPCGAGSRAVGRRGWGIASTTAACPARRRTASRAPSSSTCSTSHAAHHVESHREVLDRDAQPGVRRPAHRAPRRPLVRPPACSTPERVGPLPGQPPGPPSAAQRSRTPDRRP